MIPVCPEVEIGLDVPRGPLRVFSSDGKLKLVQSDSGADLTTRIAKFTEFHSNSLQTVDGLVLKNGSPKCAPRDAKVFSDCQGSAPTTTVPGVFTRKVLQKYLHAVMEDERRLEDPLTAGRFIKTLFTSARLRQVKALALQKPRVGIKLGKRLPYYARSRLMVKTRLG